MSEYVPETVVVSKAVWNGITHYLRSLHQQGAVDDVKMRFDNYMPLAELLELWKIEPYPMKDSPDIVDGIDMAAVHRVLNCGAR